MKRIIILAGLVLVAVAVVIFWKPAVKETESNNNLPQNTTSTLGNQQNAPKVFATATVISQKDNFYDIKAEYPQFTEVNPAFNKQISDLISEKISAFKKDAQEYWTARKATASPGEVIPENPEEPFDFIASWTRTQVNDEYISFVLNIYYFSGGAHGITEIRAFNYDVGKNKTISITEFLGKSSLSKLSQAVRSEYPGMDENGDPDPALDQMIQAGTQPVVDNFKEFNFNSNSLIIYFQQYQVAPGSYGPVTITMPESMLEKYAITSDYLK
jgi:hypothetical protein